MSSSAWWRPTAASRPLQQIGDLEIIPPRVIEYRGVTLREMDLDAVLARRPTVCLVDELAHTNAPGSRHPKRYQDIEDLLHAGIHVITTVNVQHLESLYDEIERATSVTGEGAPARSGAGRGGPDRQCRRLGRGPHRAAQHREDLPGGADQHRPGELLHAVQLDPAPRDYPDGNRPLDRSTQPPGRGRPVPPLRNRPRHGRPLEPEPRRAGDSCGRPPGSPTG